MSEDILREELAEIDKRIEEYKNDVETGKALERLHKNEDFKKVILYNYMEKEAERLFKVLITPSTLKRDVIQNIEDKLSSIRNIKQFFGVIGQNAEMAPLQIEEEQAYRKQVTAEYAELTR
jgi:hypothetical protein